MNSARNESKSRIPGEGRNQDLPLPAALGVAVLFSGLYCFIKSPVQAEILFNNAGTFIEEHAPALEILAGSALFNCLWVGQTFARTIGFVRQGAKLAHLTATKRQTVTWRQIGLSTTVFMVAIPFGLSFRQFKLPIFNLNLRLFSNTLVPVVGGTWLVTTSFALSCVGLSLLIYRWFPNKLGIAGKARYRLPVLPMVQDGIILGAIHEQDGEFPENELPTFQEHKKPEWVLMGLKGLTGNLLITGVIGSGKSQILLQFLKQILGSLQKPPALLAIDPKRTFVRELKKIIEDSDHVNNLMWVNLGGEVKFNPIWQEGMLSNSTFITVANRLKLASINFIGSSGDSRFWEQSSFNLIKYSLVFCSAKYDYFTFRELYRALMESRAGNPASALVDLLASKEWTQEEQANIEMAIDYFKDELGPMDERVRTSILTTSTSFINEFLEYRVSQILSPKREEVTLFSMREAIQNGKLILLHIENDALARSVGTLLKLMFQEEVLQRVTRPEHQEARYNEAATRELLQNFRSRIFGWIRISNPASSSSHLVLRGRNPPTRSILT